MPRGSIGSNNLGKISRNLFWKTCQHEIPDLEIVEIDERWHFTVKKNGNYGSGLRSPDLTSKSWPTPLAVAVRKSGKDYWADSIAIAWFKW